ncbi:Protein of unknown function [Catalinimonas alkaloidigena]|uniref:Tat (Twin-arginine translocation) pathway signal sequence n=1 Tax=Catalinimonas alkaloidigena TaxID=1075417 RepID=A0A1G8XI83_9BACT|nr:DUF1501 domain-containing protein [Catalinimonas alkaloidigena]SDJ90127.1 Protein of unknown function [Catalinimonas alkaloidigena]
MNLFEEARQQHLHYLTRRHFLRKCTTGLGAVYLGSLLGGCDRPTSAPVAAAKLTRAPTRPLAPLPPHFVPKAKQIIYLHMAGAPSQLELFDYKPTLQKLDGQACPESLLAGKRFAFIRGVPKMLGPQAAFRQRGQSGAWISDHLPHFADLADKVTFLKAMHTDEFNHAPAQLYMLTGSPRLGRPSIGSWVTYGLGSENDNLPGFVVLVSGGKEPDAGKSAYGSGFLPTVYQGVQCRTEGDPVLYVSNPDGMDRNLRRRTLDAINQLNQQQHEEIGDPEIVSRIAQYEMAFRMQLSVPDVMDTRKEPDYIHDLYGTRRKDATPDQLSFANNCLLARRLVERGVRFVQLFDWGWDTHGTSRDGSLNYGLADLCQRVDQPMAALVKDLDQRGLLDETLVVWGGEFGRTPMLENREGKENPFTGRDHHTEAFTMWAAGGGIKEGFSFGETDEIGYYGVKDKVHIHDLQATLLHQLGLDHERLTYFFQGRNFRLTDVGGHVVHDILA